MNFIIVTSVLIGSVWLTLVMFSHINKENLKKYAVKQFIYFHILITLLVISIPTAVAIRNDIVALENQVMFLETAELQRNPVFTNNFTRQDLEQRINDANGWLSFARRQYSKWGQWSSFRNIDWNFIQPIPPLEWLSTDECEDNTKVGATLGTNAIFIRKQLNIKPN